MKKLEQDLKDLQKIEKIILTCYGKYAKTALIQVKSDENFTSNHFILTNDCMTILNSIQLKHNQVYSLLIKVLKQHSSLNADGTKNLFIYILTSLNCLLQPKSENFKTRENIQLVKSILRKKYSLFSTRVPKRMESGN